MSLPERYGYVCVRNGTNDSGLRTTGHEGLVEFYLPQGHSIHYLV